MAKKTSKQEKKAGKERKAAKEKVNKVKAEGKNTKKAKEQKKKSKEKKHKEEEKREKQRREQGKAPEPALETKVFGKWELNRVEVTDSGLKNYINLSPFLTFHTFGRHTSSPFDRNKLSIVERLINAIMRSGTKKKIGGKRITTRKGCGKKAKAYKAVEEAFDIVNKKTGKNPIQILVTAIENSAPREETTRVKYGGITRHIAVDISPQRRVNFALRNIALGALVRAYKDKKTRGEALAEELIAAANNETTSLAIAKKNEVERVARGAR